VDFLLRVAVFVITLTAIFASMLMGVIQEGKAKYGLRYAPILIGVSFVIFFAARYLIANFLTF